MDLINKFFKLTIKFIHFARVHRIAIKSSERFIGIKDTLIGWALIAFSITLFQPPFKVIDTHLNFATQFATGAFLIFFYVLAMGLLKGKGIKSLEFLKIKRTNEESVSRSHLSPKQRTLLIYVRGFIATIGYSIWQLSKISIGIIDNSAIHSADALMYALLALVIFKQRFNIWEWVGILIIAFGVSFIFVFDVTSVDPQTAIIGYAMGVGSSFALAIILILTSMIIQHDPPIRVAFHQCLCGLVSSVLILLFFGQGDFSSFDFQDFKCAVAQGVCYSVALVFFFKAFLHTEPLIIVTCGYSLIIYIFIFQAIIHKQLGGYAEILSSLLIMIGGITLVYQEYKKDKKKIKSPIEKDVDLSRPIYAKKSTDSILQLKVRYQAGEINKYEYISEMHELNNVLFELSKIIRATPIETISIEKDAVIFILEPYQIHFEVDKSCRSAPFEILNFGHYESEDEAMTFNIIQDGDLIFDVGAHLGWYTVNLAKRFPSSKIFSFEPIPQTFEFLRRNIYRNHLSNIHLYNFGFSDSEKTAEFYFSEIGSPIASQENIFDMKKYQKIKCDLKTLDDFVLSNDIKKIAYIKCDVEGSEFLVLKGGHQILQQFHPILFLEIVESWCKKFGYSGNNIVSYLESLGYNCYLVEKGRLKLIYSIDLNIIDRFNYFFLHATEHKKLIEKYT